jgi:ABC-2 type transport system ATP-binding protein
MLIVDGLHASYGSHIVLSDLNLRIERGRLACLLGPNGAGKSTLLRVVAGQQLADRGRVVLGEFDIVASPENAPARVAFVPQDVILWEYLSASETLHAVCGLREVAKGERAALVEHWLSLTYLGGERRTIARDMSGGMRRKLAVAAAMIGNPELVLLDESFVGLDPESTWNLMGALREYCANGGTVILSSHVLDMVESIADEIIFLHGGAIKRRLDHREMREVLDANGVQLNALYMNVIHARPLQSTPGEFERSAAHDEDSPRNP